MSFVDAVSTPQLLLFCRNAADGDNEALERVLAVVNSGDQEQIQAALAMTPSIMELFEAESKERDHRSLVLTQILTALHNRSCAINPLPQSFQLPWPLSIRGAGLGSLSEEHVRAITAHKFALRSVVSCNVLPADATASVATWPLLETLCCSCLCSLFDRDISNQRDSSAQAQRMLLASSIHRLALRAAAGAAAPFLSSRLCVSMCMLLIKILAPHAHVAAQAHAAAALSTPASSQQVGANTSASAQDEVALAHTCCADNKFNQTWQPVEHGTSWPKSA